MQKLTRTQKEIEQLAKRLHQPGDSFRKWDMRLRAKQGFKDSDEVYESFCSVSGRYAIERIFQVGKDYCDEVAQTWLDTENGRVFHRERHSQIIYGGNYGYRFQGYDPKTPFRFKRKSGIEDNYGYRFLRPYQRGEERITENLKRKGATQDDVHQFGIMDLTKALADTRMETILKHSVRDFYWFMKHAKPTDAVWSAYKITIRRHHRIRNMQMWYDMINEMQFLGMDVRNPKFVCTKAYKQLHDEVVAKSDHKRAVEEKKRREENERKQMELNKRLVEERIRKYADLVIENDNLHAVVLITYNDYQEEGKTMHHCVGGYFNREYSLVLSMRDKNGKRVETVEVILTTFEIVQSQGVCNRPTSHHNEIIDLVNANMWQIKQRYAMAS